MRNNDVKQLLSPYTLPLFFHTIHPKHMPMSEQQKTQGRIPPQNLEAEQSVLGALLIDKEAIQKIEGSLNPEDFYKEAHGIIFDVMRSLYEHNEPIDVLSVSNKLAERKMLDKVGDTLYLKELTTIVPTSSHIETYSNIVQKKSMLRKLLSASYGIAELAEDSDDDVVRLLDEAEQKIFDISKKHLRQNFVDINTVLSTAFDRIDELHRNKGKLTGITTGFVEIDQMLGGLNRSDLIILAARPSVGKTTLALDMARHAAIFGGATVGIFSLEMAKEQLTDRLLAAEANIELWKMRTGNLGNDPDDNDFEKLSNALDTLSKTKIFMDDSGSANVMEVRTKARRLQSKYGLDMLIVDYLQLMEGRSHSDNRYLEVTEITRGLKQIAKELHIPVLALSQLSRTVEQRGGIAIPRLSDLRESGSIEQDADVVMFIYRKKMDRTQVCAPEEEHTAEIHIAKHRNGPTGKIDLYFDDRKTTFRNIEKYRAHEGGFDASYIPPAPGYSGN